MDIRIMIAGVCLLAAMAATAATPPHTGPWGPPGAATYGNSDVQSSGNTVFGPPWNTSVADYYLTPSAGGGIAERNVIVLEQSGSGCYVARVDFMNTTGVAVNVPSGTVEPERIFVWQMVCGNSMDVFYELEYAYAIAASGFADSYGVRIREDANGDRTFDRDGSFGYRLESNSNPLRTAELINNSEILQGAQGTLPVVNNWAQLASPIDEPITVNGMTFDDVAVFNFLGFDRVRIRQKGIGTILEVDRSVNTDPLFGGQRSRSVIYFRVDGATAGSLEGTPYLSGDVANLWFVP